MNPYWINPDPDTAEWLESDRLKREFYILVGVHIVLWVLALVGMALLYLQAQKTAPIEAYTSNGEPAWGTPMPIGSAEALQKQEEFLEKHLKSVVEHLFMRTEKGHIPELSNYADSTLLAIMDRSFSFAHKEEGGYSQTLSIEKFEKIYQRKTRRIYRLKGLISSHSLKESSNTPVYLLVAMDKRAGSTENPTGWVVWAIQAITQEDFYASETAELIKEVTEIPSSKENPDTSVENN